MLTTAASHKQKLCYRIAFLVLLIPLVIYKWQFLHLPYYWDEAWPYATGVHLMYEHGLSLLPGAIPVFVARGHPLMFHFLAAVWMHLFGTGLWAGHSFALFISLLLLLSIYWFCTTFFSERIAFCATLLFAAQAVFIAQSAYLLPEMLMALWTMLCFRFWFKQQYLLFVACGVLMLLTKESGGVLFVAFFIGEVAWYFIAAPHDLKLLLKKLGVIAVTVSAASVYFVLQKLRFGWFLYPFYMNYISSSWRAFQEGLPNGFAYLVIYDGRNAITAVTLLAVVITVIKKRSLSAFAKKFILFTLLFIVLYMVFSSVNYFIPRYLLAIFPPFIIICTVLIDRVSSAVSWLYAAAIAGLLATGVSFYCKPKKHGDRDDSPSILINTEMVHFCEQQKIEDKKIFAPALLRDNFTNKYDGYLTADTFSHVQWDFFPDTQYCIFTSDEPDDRIEQIKKDGGLVLVIRFSRKYAWCELYKVNR